MYFTYDAYAPITHYISIITHADWYTEEYTC